MKRSSQRWMTLMIILVIGVTIYICIHMGLNMNTDKVYRMVYIPKSEEQGNNFWTSLIEGAKMASEEYGVELEILSPDNEEQYEKQNELIEQAILEKPDAILVSACTYSDNTAMLKKVKENGIKLVLIDSVVDEEIEDLVVATDNRIAAKNLGTYAAQFINAGDQIVVVGHVKEASTSLDRQEGLKEGLGDKASGIQEVVYSGSIFLKAYELTVEMIKKYPDLKMVVGLNEPSAVGAARAIKEYKKQDQITMVGFDNSNEEIQLMEEGIIKGIAVQEPFNMGYMGIQQTVRLLRGEKIDKVIDSGSKLINLGNLYNEQNQKLLFPFDGGKN